MTPAVRDTRDMMGGSYCTMLSAALYTNGYYTDPDVIECRKVERRKVGSAVYLCDIAHFLPHYSLLVLMTLWLFARPELNVQRLFISICKSEEDK